MSRVLIDTNIWVDIVLNRPNHVAESKCAVMACFDQGDEVLVPATSLKDIFFFAAKSAGADAGYAAVGLVLEIATIVQVDELVCKNALSLERPDYEDGIVSACALAEQASAIVTRDAASFNDLPIPKYSPAEFLAVRGYEPVSV